MKALFILLMSASIAVAKSQTIIIESVTSGGTPLDPSQYTLYQDPTLGTGIGIGKGLAAIGSASLSVSATFGVSFPIFYSQSQTPPARYAMSGTWTLQPSASAGIWEPGSSASGTAFAGSTAATWDQDVVGTGGSSNPKTKVIPYAATTLYTWNATTGQWTSPDYEYEPVSMSYEVSITGSPFYPGFVGAGANVYQK